MFFNLCIRTFLFAVACCWSATYCPERLCARVCGVLRAVRSGGACTPSICCCALGHTGCSTASDDRYCVCTYEAFCLIPECTVTHVIARSVVLNCVGQRRDRRSVPSTGSSTGYRYRCVERDVMFISASPKPPRARNALHMRYALGPHAAFPRLTLLRPRCVSCETVRTRADGAHIKHTWTVLVATQSYGICGRPLAWCPACTEATA
jgi:hypothetical protein